MTCSEYQFWLENQVEMSPVEERDLERHLAVCPDCRRVAQAMMVYDLGVRAMQHLTVSETDENAVDKIVGAAKMTSRLRPAKQHIYLDQLVSMITEPVFRYTTAALIILTLGLFGFQEVYTLHQLDHLSQSMAQRGRSFQVQTTHFWEEISFWDKFGHPTMPDDIFTSALFRHYRAEVTRRLTHLSESEKPWIWRLRYGKTSPAAIEKIWRQRLR